MLKGKRSEKVALEIKEIVASALVNEMRDPRIGFSTVTEVTLSDDLKHATVQVSVFGDEKKRESALIALRHATGFFQSKIAKNLTLRFTPKVRFVLDEGLDHALKIDRILDQIHAEDVKDDTGSDDNKA